MDTTALASPGDLGLIPGDLGLSPADWARAFLSLDPSDLGGSGSLGLICNNSNSNSLFGNTIDDNRTICVYSDHNIVVVDVTMNNDVIVYNLP